MSLIAAVAVAAAFKFSDARELPWRTYVDAQLERTDDRVLPPPPDIAVYFGKHAAELDDLRAHPIVPSAQSGDMVLLTRMLVARSLSHHDWEDLGAAWEIQRDAWRGSFLSRLLALRGSSMIVAAARKLPPPAPKWFYEVLDVDARRAIAESLVLDSEQMRLQMAEADEPDGVVERVIDLVRRPYMAASAADYSDALRATTRSMLASRRCSFGEREFSDSISDSMATWNGLRSWLPQLGRLWQRTALFTVERERTIKTLELKAGRTPSSSSQCSDGTWRISAGPNGGVRWEPRPSTR